MRGAYRGNENMLRWALVGGIVIVVIIATIIVVSGALSGGGPKAAPHGNNNGGSGNGSACLHPRGVHVLSRLLQPPKIGTAGVGPVAAKSRLIAAEKISAVHGISLLALSPSGRRFIFVRNVHLMLGKANGPSRRLHITYEDIAFSADGTDIIYERNPKHTTYSCASLVLMSMGLSGRHKRVLFAGTFALANAPSGAGVNGSVLGTIQEDQLSTGWIVLLRRDHLYAFDPKRQIVGPLEAAALGPIYSSVNHQAAVQYSVSPNVRYMAQGSANASRLVVEKLPSGKRLYTFNSGLPVVWSRTGWRMAFVVREQSAQGSFQVIKTIDLRTGKIWTVRANRKKLGPLTLASIRWSSDGRWIGFTGARSTCLSGSCRTLAFVGTWKGKHVHVVNRGALGKQKRRRRG